MKKILRSPAATAVMLLLALVLLLTGFVDSVRAALNLQESTIYESQLSTTSIGVTLQEDGKTYASGFGVMKVGAKDVAEAAGDKEFKIGKTYSLPLAVYNSGSIDEYVRITVYKYWVAPSGTATATGWFAGEGTKDRSLDPGKIVLADNVAGWVKDPGAETLERSVYYYQGKLSPGGDPVPFPQTVTIDSSIVKEVELSSTGTYLYSYDGAGFVLQIEVDAVQTHSGDAARKGSWGLWKES